jgi:hypothetical protein
MTLVANTDTANAPVPNGKYSVSLASFLRTANTTTYAALDVVSDSTDTSAALVFPGTTRSGAVIGATMSYAGTDTNLFRLWLFDTEPTNFDDGEALALVAADMPKIVGHIDFVDADKLLVGTLQTHYTASGSTTPGNEFGHRLPYANAAGKLFGLLQAVTGFTTPVSAAKIVIRLMLEHD